MVCAPVWRDNPRAKFVRLYGEIIPELICAPVRRDNPRAKSVRLYGEIIPELSLCACT